MKATNAIRLAIVILIASSVSLYSCKKDNTGSNSSSSSNIATQGDDQAQVSDEIDNLSNDANTALSGQASFTGDASSSFAVAGGTAVSSTAADAQGNGLLTIANLICDATVTYDTVADNRVITITYNGQKCWGNRIRTGVVTITLPVGQHWKDAGATATITAQDLVITRLRDSKSITINGSKKYTNVSGGLIKDLATLGTITHTITSDGITITFPNKTQRLWHISKQRVFTYDNGIVITTTGTYSNGTDTGIAEWGTNRFGNPFTNIISEPRVIRQDCDYRLVSGQNTFEVNAGTAVVTYGLDANGNPTSCPGSGTYYYKLVWTGAGGNTYTVIAPY
jgi:hypothetical protein